MKYFVRIGDDTHEIDIEGDMVTLNGRAAPAHVQELPGTPVRLVTIGDRVHRVVARRGVQRGDYELSLEGYRLQVEALDERARAIREVSRASRGKIVSANVTAPMPGLIVRVDVAEGDEVRAGQGVAVMEAMKMENELRATVAGRVKRVLVAAGATVEKGALLLELE